MNLHAGHYLQNRKYRLQEVIGQGGFGITYKGILFTEVKGPLGAIKTEVPISIKEYFFKDYCYRTPGSAQVNVHSETGRQVFCKFKEKLIKEARILSEVHHPYIVNVLDVFEENNTAYIAMEYIAGHSLKHILERDGILPEAKALKYIHQTGQALSFVHGKNILHLDIKPSNILVDPNDNARLIDFGVSKRYDVENTETSTTMLTLSKGFASVEQYDNEGTHLFSPCPDVYSLGATMYNLLTGKIPTESILRATRAFANPSELNPDISEQTENVVLKAMQINPSDRYQTVDDMLADLGQPPIEAGTADKPAAQTSPRDEEADEETSYYDTMLQALHATPKSEDAKAGKKKNRKAWIIALAAILVAAATSAVILVGKEKTPLSTTIDLPPVTLQEEDPVDQAPADNDNTTRQAENTPPPVHQSTADPLTLRTDPATLRTEPLPQDAEEDNGYAELIASGKEKMNAGDYAGAEADFYKAMSLQPTTEATQWILSIKEKEIEDRNAQYEEKRSFGRYRIVRKIATGKYGAIDNKGEERIHCRYEFTEKAGENQAFQRQDNLYDIYNTDGELIQSGVTYYW
ncbi:MAG: serine/threonine protein kinase [Tannerellaceae bacterium]|jgi:serine/threonine-protein kinase|nr:serine/threonine protein kinase [Tannerellaceae bacterium]